MRKKGLKGLGALFRGPTLIYHKKLKKGEDLLLQGRYERALKAFDEAIELNPKEAMPWFNRGIVLGELGRNEESLRDFDRAIEIDPNFGEAWFNKAVILQKQGMSKEAINA